MMGALNLFGLGAALVGIAGAGVTAQACREALAIPNGAGARRPVLAAMIFIMAIDIFIAMMGVWVMVLDTSIGGGANG